jgi:hypothetical protein
MDDESKEMVVQKVPTNLNDALEWKSNHFGRKVAIIENYLRGAESYMIVGFFLTEAYEAEDWKLDGSGANSFFEWVEKEIKIKRSNAQRMMLIWKTLYPYITRHYELIKQIDFSKLAMVCPMLGSLTESEALDWLHMAKELTVKDLDSSIKSKKGMATQDDCDHINTEQWYKCKRCGKFLKEIV